MELDLLYRSIRRRVGSVLRADNGRHDATRVPACPDWSVSDLLAHLAGTISAVVNDDPPPPGDSQPWVDSHVDARRGCSALVNWHEWDSVSAPFERMLVRNDAVLGSLLYDAIIHEDDLNAALRTRPVRDFAALQYGLDRLFRRVDRESRSMGLGGRLQVQLSDGRIFTAGEGDPVVSLDGVDGWEAMRALGSRRSRSQIDDLGFIGDFEPWLAALPHPPPEAPLDELGPDGATKSDR